MTIFRDRVEAGTALANQLTSYANRDDVVVLGLPRGGVPVACVVARSLDAHLRQRRMEGQAQQAIVGTGGNRQTQEDRSCGAGQICDYGDVSSLLQNKKAIRLAGRSHDAQRLGEPHPRKRIGQRVAELRR